MTVTELKSTLELYPGRKLRFILPDESTIPAHFHITEVGHVRKDFIDCGGTLRTSSTCVLQAWVAPNDEEHALEAGKLARIMRLAGGVLPNIELPVEVEFENPYISQFPIQSVETKDEALFIRLATKHTDCLAKEKCGVDSNSCGPTEGSCCG